MPPRRATKTGTEEMTNENVDPRARHVTDATKTKTFSIVHVGTEIELAQGLTSGTDSVTSKHLDGKTCVMGEILDKNDGRGGVFHHLQTTFGSYDSAFLSTYLSFTVMLSSQTLGKKALSYEHFAPFQGVGSILYRQLNFREVV
ncbi:hypothetical protein F5Y06DRAFT_308341 [Hypoxylon sp. FL0890]|nr:hypothetical protein F5Y06DRAFT_308341 [Hypoxylon sp. FL0890]